MEFITMKTSSVELGWLNFPVILLPWISSFICYPRYSWALQSVRIQLQLCPG